MNSYLRNPIWVLAAGGAIGLAIWGLLAGIAQLVPAFGLMLSLAIRGAAAGFTVAPTLGTIASYGAATTGVALSIHLLVRITKEAKKEPLVWGMKLPRFRGL